MLTVFPFTVFELNSLKAVMCSARLPSRRAVSCFVLCCAAVLPRVKGQTSAVKGFTRAAPLEAITADDVHFLRFFMGPNDKVIVEDVQNNTANFVGTGVEVGNSIIYGIDKVMLSGKEGRRWCVDQTFATLPLCWQVMAPRLTLPCK